jgi:hypothetical protein
MRSPHWRPFRTFCSALPASALLGWPNGYRSLKVCFQEGQVTGPCQLTKMVRAAVVAVTTGDLCMLTTRRVIQRKY